MLCEKISKFSSLKNELADAADRGSESGHSVELY